MVLYGYNQSSKWEALQCQIPKEITFKTSRIHALYAKHNKSEMDNPYKVVKHANIPLNSKNNF